MSGSQFSITGAVRNAYVFLGEEWRYLAKLSLLPIGVSLITKLVLYNLWQSITPMMAVMVNLPTIAFTAWFVFLEVRLLLLGERVNALSREPAFLENRNRCMTLCIITFVLFYMGAKGLTEVLFWSSTHSASGDSLTYVLAGAFATGLGIWGLRFILVPLLTAVDYPVKPYIARVEGVGISFRLLGVMLLGSFPVIAVFMTIMMMVLPPIPLHPVPGVEFEFPISLLLLDAPLAMTVWAALAAAGCYVLKEILGKNGEQRGVKP